MLGRIEVQAGDVAHLLDEKWIGGELEAAAAMRLHAKQCQIAMHRGGGQSGLIGQAASRPVSLTRRALLQRRIDQLCNLLLGGGAGSPRLKLIVQPGNSATAKTAAPQTHRRSRRARAPPHPPASQAL